MLITKLEATWYLSRWGNWQTIDYPNPDWDTIQFWIECLDRDEIPFINLLIEQTPGDEGEFILVVVGGYGEYLFEFYDRGHLLCYRDDSRSDRVVSIWKSDQGCFVSEKYLCNDIELVFIVVRYFAETGKAFPGVNWTDD